MLTYDLERRGQLARYDYLYRCIKGDIFSGTLAAGEKLPSKRALARHLQVSVATVESAYNQLAAEGYIVPQEKRGYFVAAVETAPRSQPPLGTRETEGGAEGAWLLDLKGGSG